MLLGAFFDVQNLMEVAGRFTALQPSTPASRQSIPGLPGTTIGGRVGSLPPVTGAVCRPRRRRDLEEEIEAQEGQGGGARQRAPASRTIHTEKASKVPTSKRAVPAASAMTQPVRSQRGRTPGGPGLWVTRVPRVVGNILRGVVASRGSRLASAGSGETGRTPGSAAGCNKPASPSAEKPGEVVRNHAVGTGLSDWHPRAEGDGLRPVAGSGRASVLRKKVKSRRRGSGARRPGRPGRPVRPQGRRSARAGPGSR